MLLAAGYLVFQHRIEFRRRWDEHFGAGQHRPDPTAIDVEVSESALRVVLSDGRELSAPLAWCPRLRDTSKEQRRDWKPIGRGHGLHWPDLDEDVSGRTLMGHSS